jgi:hypothetical protein
MDSSDLTKNRRDRVLANSYTSQGIASRHLVPNITSSTLLSFKYGAKLVEFNKKTVLPNCGGTNGVGCTQDLIIQSDGEVTLLPPSSPFPPNSSISYDLPDCPIDQPTVATYPVIFSGGILPPGGEFAIELPPPGFGLNPVTIDPVTGTITIPAAFPAGSGTDPTGIYVVTYTLGSFSLQVSFDLQG